MNVPSFRKAVVWLLAGITVLYVLLCIASLLLIPLTGMGWMEPDAFIAIYAVALAMPWIFVLPDMAILGSYSGLAMILLGMLANLAILLGLARWIGRRERLVET